jgi:hypothetical protein
VIYKIHCLEFSKLCHSTLQDSAQNLKMERLGLHVIFYYYSACLGKLRKDERKLQYNRSNILGFINTYRVFHE